MSILKAIDLSSEVNRIHGRLRLDSHETERIPGKATCATCTCLACGSIVAVKVREWLSGERKSCGAKKCRYTGDHRRKFGHCHKDPVTGKTRETHERHAYRNMRRRRLTNLTFGDWLKRYGMAPGLNFDFNPELGVWHVVKKLTRASKRSPSYVKPLKTPPPETPVVTSL